LAQMYLTAIGAALIKIRNRGASGSKKANRREQTRSASKMGRGKIKGGKRTATSKK